MLTFLVYLNGEGVKGGCTNFLKDSEGAMDLDRMRDEEGLYRAMDQDILESVQPEEGSCLIFWHPLLHEGQKLEPNSASKFILRSDIMYRLAVAPEPQDGANVRSPRAARPRARSSSRPPRPFREPRV